MIQGTGYVTLWALAILWRFWWAVVKSDKSPFGNLIIHVRAWESPGDYNLRCPVGHAKRDEWNEKGWICSVVRSAHMGLNSHGTGKWFVTERELGCRHREGNLNLMGVRMTQVIVSDLGR